MENNSSTKTMEDNCFIHEPKIDILDTDNGSNKNNNYLHYKQVSERALWSVPDVWGLAHNRLKVDVTADGGWECKMQMKPRQTFVPHYPFIAIFTKKPSLLRVTKSPSFLGKFGISLRWGRSVVTNASKVTP